MSEHERHYRRGRGATLNPAGRFAETVRVRDIETVPDSVATEVRPERARTIITRNRSPDIPFEQSINPYRGCEHVMCGAERCRPERRRVFFSAGNFVIAAVDMARILLKLERRRV